MLSYMLPGEDKPLGLPPQHPHSLPGELSQSPATSEEKPSPPESVSTVNSDKPEKPRAKFAINGTKHAGLKRVSFGSSKGSMVETLVYESPLQEEPEESAALLPNDSDEADNAAKVRVTFFQAERPLVVSSPEPDDTFVPDEPDSALTLDPAMAATAVQGPPLPDGYPAFHRQGSTDSGWDNPFRPDGDLSREADEIVELIKGGKPITPNSGTVGNSFSLTHDVVDVSLTQTETTQQSAASPLLNNSTSGKAASPVGSPDKGKSGANGSAAPTDSLEVQHVRIGSPGDASQVEHVVIKKKPRCKCCVIQ